MHTQWGLLSSRDLMGHLPNAISLARLIVAGVVLPLCAVNHVPSFRWMLLACLLSDFLDGGLARMLGVCSAAGAQLDSIADVLTIASGLLGIVLFHPGFLSRHASGLLLVAALYALEVALSLLRYGRVSSFHTVLGRLAAVLASVFVMALFLLPGTGWLYPLTVGAFVLSLAEELILLAILPCWTADVRGLYWVVRQAGKLAGDADHTHRTAGEAVLQPVREVFAAAFDGGAPGTVSEHGDRSFGHAGVEHLPAVGLREV